MSELCRVKAIVQNEQKLVIVTRKSLVIGTVHIPAENIKRQMQSKPNSKKIQLLVETINAAHLEGKYKLELLSLNDREMLKNALAQIIDSTSGKDMEIALSHQIGNDDPKTIAQTILLQTYPMLRKLFTELVPQQMSESEFWSTREHLVNKQLLLDQQERGVSLGVLSHSTAESVDEGEKRFTLTPAVIQSIFIQYPSIRDAYEETVPDRVSEHEFWTRYFKSRLFHRIRDKKIHLTIDASDIVQGTLKDDIFDKCLTHEMSNRVNAIVVDDSKLDKYLNLESTSRDKETELRPDFTMRMKEGLVRGLNRQSFGLLEHVQSTRREPVLIQDLNPVIEPEPEPMKLLGKSSYTFSNSSMAALKSNKALDDFLPSMSLLSDQFIQHCQESSMEIQQALAKQRHIIKLSDLPAETQLVVKTYKNQSLEYCRHFWTSIQVNNMSKAHRMVDSIQLSQATFIQKLQRMKENKIVYITIQHIYKSADNILKKWKAGDFAELLDR